MMGLRRHQRDRVGIRLKGVAGGFGTGYRPEVEVWASITDEAVLSGDDQDGDVVSTVVVVLLDPALRTDRRGTFDTRLITVEARLIIGGTDRRITSLLWSQAGTRHRLLTLKAQ